MNDPKVTKRQVYGSSVTSYTLNAPEYLHNQQIDPSNPVVQPLNKEMTLNGYVEEEAPKKKRAPRKKKQAPTIEVDLDAVQDIVEQDLVKRGYKQPLPKEE